jgi:hypothetical protein
MVSNVLENTDREHTVMADKKPRISGKPADTQIGESDEFVLPVAPPPAPPPSRTTPAATSASGRSSKLPAPENNAPPLPILRKINEKETLPVHSNTESETDNNYGASSDASAPSNGEKAAPSSLVAWLACAVVILLVVVIIQYNHTSEYIPAPVPSSAEAEGELSKARAEAEGSRREIEQMEANIRGREEHLAASQDAAERKMARLAEENKKLKELNLELSAETSRLKERLQTATRLATGSESPPPGQKTPAVQQDGQAYRVTGLRPGDTLNVRSGPGVSNPVVTALHNGARVTVTGASIMNGPDEWLPCTITLNGVDPATGYNRSWDQKCWINSFFIERSDN